MGPDAVEIRILGCLLEKQRTTPDTYPLTLNALRLACNQATNRDPVLDYDEADLRSGIDRLQRRGWVRFTSGHGSRTAKYRQLFDEALGLGGDQLALLCVMMLRGPQTPGELKQRTERLHPFAGLEAIETTLARLIERGHVTRRERRPGQKEARYEQLIGGETEAEGGAAGVDAADAADAAVASSTANAPHAPASDDETGARIARIEADVATLRHELAVLRRRLG